MPRDQHGRVKEAFGGVKEGIKEGIVEANAQVTAEQDVRLRLLNRNSTLENLSKRVVTGRTGPSARAE